MIESNVSDRHVSSFSVSVPRLVTTAYAQVVQKLVCFPDFNHLMGFQCHVIEFAALIVFFFRLG